MAAAPADVDGVNELTDDDLDLMVQSGIVGLTWRQAVVIFAEYNIDDGDTQTQVFRNEFHDQHAEVLLIEHLKLITTGNAQKLNLTTYFNYSPCAGCSEKLITYVNDTEILVKFTLKFAHLFRAKNEANNAGLRNLVKLKKMEVKPTVMEDWEKLFTGRNGQLDEYRERRQDTDELVDEMFKRLITSKLDTEEPLSDQFAKLGIEGSGKK